MNPEIERYLSDLEGRLRVSARRRSRALEDSCDHLVDSYEAGVARGLDASEAVSSAIDRYGHPVVVARHINAEYSSLSLRRSPVGAIGIAAVMFGSMLVAVHSHHTNSPATIATQVFFSAAVIAGEVALAAGIVLVGRLAETSRRGALTETEGRLVRRTGLLLYGFEALAALMLVIAVVVNKVRTGSLGPNLGVGILAMSLAAVAACVAARRLEKLDPVGVVTPGRSGSAALATRAHRVFGVVARHPVASCGAVAVIAAYGAMGRAETTAANSLYWGAGQVIVVIVAFVALRDYLGLRTPIAFEAEA